MFARVTVNHDENIVTGLKITAPAVSSETWTGFIFTRFSIATFTITEITSSLSIFSIYLKNLLIGRDGGFNELNNVNSSDLSIEFSLVNPANWLGISVCYYISGMVQSDSRKLTIDRIIQS